MLDIKWLRENLDEAGASLKRRGDGTPVELEGLLDRDEQRRQCLKESETLKNQKKKLSATVGRLKKDGQDAADEMEQVRQINLRIKDLDAEVKTC